MYVLINKATKVVEHEIEANGGSNAIDIVVSLVGVDWQKTHTLATLGGLNE